MLKQVESWKELGELKQICWDDAQFIVGKITVGGQQEFPEGIHYSGYQRPNFHLLYCIDAGPRKYLELVLVGCDYLDSSLIESMYVNGTISTLSNVTFKDIKERDTAQCCALLYEYHDLDYEEATSFFRSKNVR
jgi:hypothetical protein